MSAHTHTHTCVCVCVCTHSHTNTQMELSVRHTPSIPVIPVSDRDGFIALLVVCGREQKKKSSDSGAASRQNEGSNRAILRPEPRAAPALVTDKRLRSVLACLPGLSLSHTHSLSPPPAPLPPPLSLPTSLPPSLPLSLSLSLCFSLISK